MSLYENQSYATELIGLESMKYYSFQDLLIELIENSEPAHLYQILCDYIHNTSGAKITLFSSYNSRTENFKIEKVSGDDKLLKNISNELIIPLDSLYYTLNNKVESQKNKVNNIQNLNIKSDVDFITVGAIKWGILENDLRLEQGYSLLFIANNKVYAQVIMLFDINGELKNIDALPAFYRITIKTLQRIEEERYIQEKENLYNLLMEQSHDSIFVLDQKKIVFSNQRAVELTGYYEEELNQLDFLSIVHPDNHKDFHEGLLIKAYLNPEGNTVFHTKLLTKEGDEKKLEVAYSIIKFYDRENILLCLKDITERDRAEQEINRKNEMLKQKGRLYTLGTIAGGVAHEVNNPLTGMINFAQIIHDKIEDPKLRRFAHIIIKEGKRIGKIVRNLLDFSGFKDEKAVYANMEDVLKDALSLVRSTLKSSFIVLNTNFETTIPSLKCKSHQIEQVFLNLLMNARDALNEKYPEYHAEKHLTINLSKIEIKEKQYIKIEFYDTGIGVHEKNIKNIFKPFFTTKTDKEGTGLGLFLSKSIITEHKGTIKVESIYNSYTKFTIQLPVIL